jgi:hypothetical protein
MSITPDSFEVEVPITHMVDPEGLYTYKVVKQDGKWLLDSDYWLDLHYIYFLKNKSCSYFYKEQLLTFINNHNYYTDT